MATQTFTADAQALDFTMASAGIFVCDMQRTSGDITLTLQISIDGGSNFVNYFDESGEAQSRSLSSSVPHAKFEVLGQKDHVFRVLSSASASSPIR